MESNHDIHPVEVFDGNQWDVSLVKSLLDNAEIYFNYHRQSDLETAFLNNGFKLVQAKRQDYVEPDGSLTTDLIFIGIRQ